MQRVYQIAISAKIDRIAIIFGGLSLGALSNLGYGLIDKQFAIAKDGLQPVF